MCSVGVSHIAAGLRQNENECTLFMQTSHSCLCLSIVMHVSMLDIAIVVLVLKIVYVMKSICMFSNVSNVALTPPLTTPLAPDNCRQIHMWRFRGFLLGSPPEGW